MFCSLRAKMADPMEHSSKIQNRKAFLEKLEELKCLNLPSGEYAITGSGPMAIRGLREANDIDVVVKKTLWLELLKRFVPYDSKHIRIGNIEIWGDFLNLTERMEDVIDSAERLAGYPFRHPARYFILEKIFQQRERQKRYKNDRRDSELVTQESILKSHLIFLLTLFLLHAISLTATKCFFCRRQKDNGVLKNGEFLAGRSKKKNYLKRWHEKFWRKPALKSTKIH